MRFLTGFSLMLLLLTGCGESKDKAPAPVTNIDSMLKLYPDSVDFLVKHGNVLL